MHINWFSYFNIVTFKKYILIIFFNFNYMDYISNALSNNLYTF